MSDINQRQLSSLVSNRLPEFVRVDHPTLVAFLEAYYEWLQVSDRGGKILSPMVLGDVIDVDTTLDDFLDEFKREYLLNFPEELAISKATGKPVDLRKLVKNIKAFYRAKGTEKSYEFLFRILYDVGVEFYYPKKDILRVSDGKWYERNSIKATNSLGNRIFDCVGRIIYQKNASGQITASAKVTDVTTYQEGLYEVAELNIVGRNGSFTIGKPFSFDTDEETLSELKVYSVISSVTVNSAGSGYAVGDTVTFTTATGDAGLNARGTVSLVNSSGGIRKIRIDSYGLNYGTAPTVSVQSLGGSGFSGTATIGSVCQSDGYYLNYDGRISTDKVLQDNHYYQEYSYVLKTEVIVDRYREAVRRLVHPAGTAMFGQVLIKRCAYEDLDNTSALIRYEVPVIGHYAPYTFLTYDNLQDWFRYSDPVTNLSITAGYDPLSHNDFISNCSIPGNPISSNFPFDRPSLFSAGGFLGAPTDSIPDYSIPQDAIPNREEIATPAGPVIGNPLGEVGFKNSYPFWFIYEHPNRRIKEPTIAQVWKNQIVDGLTFGWNWSEHCSPTGGPPPTGWTADFYGDNPVSKKYAFLKYDSGSAFRKITARAFFEIPIGVPFDCRNFDPNSITQPEIAISDPKNGQIISDVSTFDENGNLVVSMSFINSNNNNLSIPAERRVVAIRVLVNGKFYSNIDVPTSLQNDSNDNFSFTVFGNILISDGLTRNTIVAIPVNEYGSLAIGYTISEIGFIVGSFPLPSFSIVSPLAGEVVDYDDNAQNFIITLKYDDIGYNRFLNSNEKVTRLYVFVEESDTGNVFEMYVPFGTTTIFIPSQDLFDVSVNQYTVIITPQNERGENTTKVTGKSTYFSRS
jgi:hypothetical protein